MTGPQISEISAQDSTVQKALLDLNNAHAKETSALSRGEWRNLVGNAFAASCIENAAFLIAFDQNADYDNANFNWFRARYDRFIYVDRIVVSSDLRGTGAAQTLYDDLFHRCNETGHDWVVCEVNIDPPNPGSDAFHKKFGFVEVGVTKLADRDKTVRYLACRVQQAAG